MVHPDENPRSEEATGSESTSQPNDNVATPPPTDEIDYKEKYMRLYAEFENFKKRTSKEKTEWIQLAGKDILISMTEVLDDCLRAEEQLQKIDEHSTPEIKPFKEGITLVFNKLKNNLKQKGVLPMDSIGKDFDVVLHEAISEMETGDEAKKGKVIAEVEKGYMLGDKVLRYAKVIVGK